jgi:FeS assembly SUF system protein
MTDLKEQIIDQLREVYDPEIPINVYDLGLIYELNIKENNDVHVVMSLTSPTCPTADYLKMMIQEAVEGTEGVNEVTLELTFEPKWTPDRVSQEAKEELGLVSAPSENLAVQSVFQGDQTNQGVLDKEDIREGVLNENSVVKELVCFNCGATEEKRPIIECNYKGEKTAICTSCTTKF